jgi:hypothetical protein
MYARTHALLYACTYVPDAAAQAALPPLVCQRGAQWQRDGLLRTLGHGQDDALGRPAAQVSYLSFYLPIYLPIDRSTDRSIDLSIYLRSYLPTYLFIFLSVYQPSFTPS